MTLCRRSIVRLFVGVSSCFGVLAFFHQPPFPPATVVSASSMLPRLMAGIQNRDDKDKKDKADDKKKEPRYIDKKPKDDDRKDDKDDRKKDERRPNDGDATALNQQSTQAWQRLI